MGLEQCFGLRIVGFGTFVDKVHFFYLRFNTNKGEKIMGVVLEIWRGGSILWGFLFAVGRLHFTKDD